MRKPEGLGVSWEWEQKQKEKRSEIYHTPQNRTKGELPQTVTPILGLSPSIHPKLWIKDKK